MKRGIDVSTWNAVSDYGKVKKAGVEFAIVKVNNQSATPDKRLATHVDGFRSAGIPCCMGYCYCYATNTEKAKAAAQGFVTLAKQYGIEYMWLDLEDAVTQGLGSVLIDVIDVFRKYAADAGLKFGIYTGAYYYNTYLKPYSGRLGGILWWFACYPNTKDRLITDPLPTTTILPKGITYCGWQYSSKGLVDGIKGYVDCDVWYCDEEVTGGQVYITTDFNPYTEPTRNVTLGTTGNDANWVLWYLWRFGLLVDSHGTPDSSLINSVIDASDYAAIMEAQKRLGLQEDGIVGRISRSIFKKVA